MKKMRAGSYLVVRLDPDEEVVSSLSQVVNDEKIRSAVIVSFVGALKGGRLILRKGLERDVTNHVEAVGNGNISYYNGEPFVHIHASVGNDDGAWVGHLLRGITDIFCEIVLAPTPAPLVRKYSKKLEESGVTVPYELDME